MTITFRPAIRRDTPLIIGLAGPTKSGKTLSALRLATGLAGGKPIIMINAEGARGHQYADKFRYLGYDLVPPFRPEFYTEAITEAAEMNAGCIIIDSASHMHDGPGGILEWHEQILDDTCGIDQGKRQRNTFTAWIKPKAAENEFIYALLGLNCPVVLCLRAKEKLKIVPGKQPVDLGWQPIVGERVAFETMFTLMLTPHCKGVPDLEISDMREPFDAMVPAGRQIDERLGEQLAAWARGVNTETGELTPPPDEPKPPTFSELMRGAGLVLADLAPILGGTPTRENIGGLVDQWLAQDDERTFVDLCDLAASRKREPVMAGRSQPEQTPFV